MRICFVSRRFFPTVSGMSVYAANLLRELVRQGHDVTMLAQYRDDPVGRGVYGGGPPPEVPGVTVIGMPSLGEWHGGDFERDLDALVDTIVAEHGRQPFDILHAQYGYPPGLAVLEASKRLGVPNLVSIQGGDGHWVGTCCRTHRDAMRAVLDHAGALIIGARSFAEEVEQNLGVPPERFTVIPGAIDLERFFPREGWRAGELLDEARPTLLYHGRVDRRKGALDLLDAFAILLRDGRKIRLVVSGIGPDSEAVATRVSELGLGDGVEITGYAAYDEAPQAYRRADIFLSPTYAEGFSNTILEAMACGLPIVSTRAVGVVDCLRDGENGLLVQPGDASAIAAATARLLDDAALRAELAIRARDEVRELYAWPVIAGRIEAVYRQLLGRSPDDGWSVEGPPDLSCRFRAAPHLL